MRIVPPDFRSHAMGLQIIFLRLLGRIPSPIITGELFDRLVILMVYYNIDKTVLLFRACSLWQTTCGVKGSCRLYHRHELMLYWLGVHLVYKFLSILCWGGAMLTYKPGAETVVQATDDADENN